MRKLLVLFALSLSTSAAWAQADKAPAVTKLPGEENLSTRERAERDFLMPVRRKKAAEMPKPTASAEQLNTAAPETDATAHYNEAPVDPRTEEVAAPAHETATRSKAARHAAWLAARRAHLREVEAAEAARAARHSSKSSKASRAKAAKAAKHSSKSTKAKHHSEAKASSHHSSKKAASHKSKKSEAKKTVHHTASKKVKTKTKPAAKHKHRR